jgi:hypothetical protein
MAKDYKRLMREGSEFAGRAVLVTLPLIPAKAGIQQNRCGPPLAPWVPAFAGMSGIRKRIALLIRRFDPG